ncbi:MAG TPA: alpha/beta hydrolase-fold protein [Candidatus Didemnitutus sp.]|nr:alpha/beta hydrolase-fold protein [Candidatus Didemnitutus sp.]
MPSPTFKLTSPETGSDYWIYLAAAGAAGEPRVPLIFLDGDDQFAAAATAAKKLGPNLPSMLLVGIGYGASYGKPLNRRGRDYTPTRHADEPTSGGADIFAVFLERTLWPELERRHDLDHNRRLIGGHSLGSLFVLHALFQPKPFFTHFLASAPSIWWDDRRILDRMVQRRSEGAALAGKLFLGVGVDDSESMSADLDLFTRELAARPFEGLSYTYERFEGFNHYNVLPASFGAGIAWLLK